jgi:hypothetical protein
VSCFVSFPAHAKYNGGMGEPDDPFQIATAEDLMLLGDSPEDYGKHFILTADIDLDPNLPGRKVFNRAVIAPNMDDTELWFRGIPFHGVFDGNNHTISHLVIQGGSYLGLFGLLESTGRISNLGLEAVDVNGTGAVIGGLVAYNYVGSIAASYSTGTVNGNEDVGGLVGYNRGSVTQSSSTGTINGSGDYIGGLVGFNRGSITQSASTCTINGTGDYIGGLAGSNLYGSITRSSSSSTVNGNEQVGGLVGHNNMGSITTSYSTSTISGESLIGGLVGRNDGSIVANYSTGAVSGKSLIGGLVGENRDSIATSYSTGEVSGEETAGGLVGGNRGNISASFWDTETSRLGGSDGGVGLTTAEMMDPNMLGLNGFANDPNWILDAGHDYPRLAWEGTAGDIIVEPVIDWMEGHGTEQNPYRIDIADQLILLGKASILWDKRFVLGADIDMDPNLPNRRIFEQAIIPIFTGECDGNNHVISNLVIAGGSHLGLFGRLQNGAVVKDLGIVDVNITGSTTGALVGYNRESSITNCHSTGTVSGGEEVGGLVGYNRGNITQSSSTGTVSGDEEVGGLAGLNGGSIATSYSTGVVDGNEVAGGLVGYNRGSITQSSSTGTVNGNREVGGLVGSTHGGSITTSYSTGTISGDWGVGGLVGRNGGGIGASYSTGTVHGNWGVGGLVGYNYVGSIAASYSTGTVSGNEEVGGLVGYGEVSNFWQTNCFWNTETSGQDTSVWGTGKTTAEMQTTSTFLEAGWDFLGETANGTDDIWWILEGQDYPRLWWELVEE